MIIPSLSRNKRLRKLSKAVKLERVKAKTWTQGDEFPHPQPLQSDRLPDIIDYKTSRGKQRVFVLT